jgi:hypothetical protein
MYIPIDASFVALALYAGGFLLLLYSVFKVEGLKFMPFLMGVALIYAGSRAAPTPTPTPGPGPGPGPPIGTFADNIKAAFTGTKAEAQVLAALHEAYAKAIEFDGRRSQPRITNTTQMGTLFAECQRYQSGSETPWGDRFTALAGVLSAEAINRGILVRDKTMPLDANRRAAAVTYFREVWQVLGGLK